MKLYGYSPSLLSWLRLQENWSKWCIDSSSLGIQNTESNLHLFNGKHSPMVWGKLCPLMFLRSLLGPLKKSQVTIWCIAVRFSFLYPYFCVTFIILQTIIYIETTKVSFIHQLISYWESLFDCNCIPGWQADLSMSVLWHIIVETIYSYLILFFSVNRKAFFHLRFPSMFLFDILWQN